MYMRYLHVLLILQLIIAGTTGGALSGVGEDLKKVGDIIKFVD